MATQKAKIVGVGQSLNGNGAGPQVSDPDDFPLPVEGVITVELTTGRVVQILIGELEMFYEAGEIPNELTRIAAAELMLPDPTSDAAREKRYKERLRLRDWLVERVLVAPKVAVERLYQNERWQIYNMTNTPALALDNFRRQQARHVGLVHELQDVGASAESETELATAPE